MGTTYTVKTIIRFPWFKPSLQAKLDARLSELVSTFSTYDENSEISRINRLSSGSSFQISPDFNTVFLLAKKHYQLSEGLFDPTIGPLLSLWGFGANSTNSLRRPAEKDINYALSLLDFDTFSLNSSDSLLKSKQNITLDFSSIAKGYAIDELAELLDAHQIDAYFIELGGEIRVKGHRINGDTWKVGIADPSQSYTAQKPFSIIPLTNQALATSGSYRQQYESDLGIVSHIIHPKTGMALVKHIVSVSVIAPTCVDADAYATWLLLKPVEEGLKLVNSDPLIDAFFIVKTDGSFTTFTSKNWPKSLTTMKN